MQRKQERPKRVPKLVSIARIDANSRRGGREKRDPPYTFFNKFANKNQIKPLNFVLFLIFLAPKTLLVNIQDICIPVIVI